MKPVLRADHVSKEYVSSGEVVAALRDVSLSVGAGELIAVVGPSGCGKSTLLHVLGAMDRPSTGQVWLEDSPLHALSDADLTKLRRCRIGFVFQAFHLLPTLSVTENVALPLMLEGHPAALKDSLDLIAWVGLSKRRTALPSELSGGEMQRVAVARALVHKPAVILADEPTGNLDSENGKTILALLRDAAMQQLAAVVLATHSAEAAAAADRVLKMKDGMLLPE